MLLQDIPETSGIYRIICTVTSKLYIGSAIDLHIRWIGHRSELRRKDHHNQKLQYAWDKYGESTFIFEIIEFVLPPFLLEREQYWLDKLQPFGHVGFNIAHTAQSPYLGRKSSPETCAKLSAANKGRSNPHMRKPKSAETRARISAANKKAWQKRGKRSVSPEARLKQSHIMLGRKQSEEACTRKSASHKARWQRIRESQAKQNQ